MQVSPDKVQQVFDNVDEKVHVVDRKSTRLNSSHSQISYAVFCLKKKKIHEESSFMASKALELAIRADEQLALANERRAEPLMELDYLYRAQYEMYLTSTLRTSGS